MVTRITQILIDFTDFYSKYIILKIHRILLNRGSDKLTKAKRPILVTFAANLKNT